MTDRNTAYQNALAALTSVQRQLLIDWLKLEAEAYNDSSYSLPSYSDPAAGAEHAIDALVTRIEEFTVYFDR